MAAQSKTTYGSCCQVSLAPVGSSDVIENELSDSLYTLTTANTDPEVNTEYSISDAYL